jgi:hypothetical protein
MPINLTKTVEAANRKASQHQIWATRSRAIQAYAKLEQELCRLFAITSGVTPEVAGIIFFRIASASARNDILDKLVKLRYGNQYNLFWNSVFRALRLMDLKRNEIVHWLILTETVFYQGEGDFSIALRHPRYWRTPTLDAPKWTNRHLLNFRKKCDFYADQIGTFCDVTASDTTEAKISPDLIAAWLDRFRKPLIYPPAESDVPIARPPPEPDRPPRSSPV